MNNLIVKPIDKYEVKEWCLYKHYAKRMPMAVEYSFGLFINNKLEGISIFGPTAPPVPITLFGEIGKYKVRELTRLVVNENLPKNSLSIFLSQSLKLMPSPICLISFADKGSGHHGYIYQATNWIYTGEGGQKDNYIDDKGNDFHSLTINDRLKEEKLDLKEYLLKHNIKKVKADPKYRYLYFLGNKREVKNMKKELKLNILNYPKGKNERYDSSYICAEQTKLF